MSIIDEPHLIQDRESIRTFISLSAKLLDDKRYTDFVELFVEAGTYVMEAESDEIGQRMTWLEISRDELASLLEESSQHVHDLATRTHLVSVDNINFITVADPAEVLSTFAVFRTDTTGSTQIYAVGRYNDKLVRHGKDWRIRERRVQLQTRMFRTPTPMPL